MCLLFLIFLPQTCRRRNKEGCQLNGQIKRNLFEHFRRQDNLIQSHILVNCIEFTRPKGGTMLAAQSTKVMYTYWLNWINVINRWNFSSHTSIMWPWTDPAKKICRATLINFFGISVGRLVRVINEMKEGKLVPEDQRGKHNNRPQNVPDLVRGQILQHIESYRTYVSHYCRQRNPPNTRYLSPDLNVSIMFESFLQDQRDNARQECEQWVYQDIFNRVYPHLTLCAPKCDTCDECDRFTDAFYPSVSSFVQWTDG
jgi:hypothetical protein